MPGRGAMKSFPWFQCLLHSRAPQSHLRIIIPRASSKEVEFSPFFSPDGNWQEAPAWYSSSDREIHISANSPAFLFDGIEVWDVLISIRFTLHANSLIDFSSDPGELYANNIVIIGNPDFGLGMEDVIGFLELHGANLVLN